MLTLQLPGGGREGGGEGYQEKLQSEINIYVWGGEGCLRGEC